MNTTELQKVGSADAGEVFGWAPADRQVVPLVMPPSPRPAEANGEANGEENGDP